jgi:hypothetical protein
LPTAIRDWAPDPARDVPLADEEPEPAHWRVRIPVPQGARDLLGADAAVTLDVRPRATLDRA